MHPPRRPFIVGVVGCRNGDAREGKSALSTRAGTLRVLVADDHRLMQAAIRRTLDDADDFEVVGAVSIGSHVAPAVNETKPDIVLLDLRMPELDGLECLRRLRRQHPKVAVVILSSSSDAEQIQAARTAGALGYVVKTVEPIDLPTVLRTATSGAGFAVWGAAEPEPVDARPAILSDRESGVLEAVAQGLSNREIAAQLWISEQTVKFHLRNIYRKLGLASRTEAARYAHRSGLAGLTLESA
jgi:DNA-binding NarL/FixJ family response regulator